jgi:hypothetical protein
MTHTLYCLECNAIVGEGFERGEAARGDGLDLCQTCAQHEGPAAGPPRPRPDARLAGGFWPWRLSARRDKA